MVDREKARFSTWYEVFPRSCSPEPGRHGTLRDCEASASLHRLHGFRRRLSSADPSDRASFRKGKNNSTEPQPDDVGSPWAIGSEEGGHTSIHPQLGTLEDFKHFRSAAEEHGLEVALDIAFQCTPDHPYVREHREWFRKRPDGTIQYAENPPKKYQDIFPLDFETPQWQALWDELKSVFDFWIEQGVRIFRVDNPHTKPFAFWEWVIGEIKEAVSGRDLPGGGVHKAPRDVPAGQARLFPVLHVFHLAQHERGTDRLLHRAHANRSARILSAESLAEYAGHSAANSCRSAGAPPS